MAHNSVVIGMLKGGTIKGRLSHKGSVLMTVEMLLARGWVGDASELVNSARICPAICTHEHAFESITAARRCSPDMVP